MAEVTIYTTSWCPFCTRAKALLDELGQDYTEFDVDSSAEMKAEMVEKAGRTSVPQIFIDGEHVGGCDDLYALHGAGELKSKLGK